MKVNDIENSKEIFKSPLPRVKGGVEELNFKIEESKKRQPLKKFKFFGIHIELKDDIFFHGLDPILLLRKLKSLGTFETVRANIIRVPDLHEIDPRKNYIFYDLVLRTKHNDEEIKDVFIFVYDNNKIRISDISSRFVDDVDVELAEKKLGEILVDEGIIAEEEVERIAGEHKKIGEEIAAKTAVKYEEIQKILIKKQKSQTVQMASTIRVETDKLDKLINLVGEMGISVSRLSVIARDTGSKEIIDCAAELDRISRDLREKVMMARMVALESTFKRFYRVVRDMANSQKKNIELHISGEETKLDKAMIEQITDPLKHMVHNSVNHGIESPQERKKTGKPEKGNIWLRAYQEEGNVVIEIEDDGKGIDPELIYKKAVSRGWVKKNRYRPGKEELYSFLFRPGFSTAPKVTEISGLGVGLDVVKKNIQSLKGRIEIFSTVGKGSKFKIKIPLTIAIIDGMRLRIGSHTYIVPLDYLVESFQLSALDLKDINAANGLVNWRGEVYPLIKLHKYLDHRDKEVKKEDLQKGIVVLVKTGFKKFCIYVDETLGISQAVVVKNLQDNYRSIPGIIGASLNGDGSISLILDIPGLGKIMNI
jgi:two-component system chemotaxis sensor kinase CheA